MLTSLDQLLLKKETLFAFSTKQATLMMRSPSVRVPCYKDRLPALLATITSGWKSLTATNTLAYYNTKLITAIKKFILLASGSLLSPIGNCYLKLGFELHWCKCIIYDHCCKTFYDRNLQAFILS